MLDLQLDEEKGAVNYDKTMTMFIWNCNKNEVII